MKKFLGILSAVALLLTMVGTLGVLTFAKTSDVAAPGSWESVEYGFHGITYGADGTMTFGDSPSDTLTKMCYTFAEEVDLFYVQDIHFTFKNTSGLPISFYADATGVKAVKTTNDNSGVAEFTPGDIEFWNSHPGCLWVLAHDFGAAPFEIKAAGTDTWVKVTDASLEGKFTEQVGNMVSVLTIPAGWEGDVRLPLTGNDQSFADGTHRTTKAFSLGLNCGTKDSSSDLHFSAYAGKTFSITNIGMTQESADGVTGSWSSVEYGFHGLTYAENGTITFGANPGDNATKMLFTFDEEVNLYYAEYLTFDFKNDTGLPLPFHWIAAKAAKTTNNNAGIIDTDIEFWDQHPGCLWALNHDCGAAPVEVKAAGSDEWVAADRTPASEYGDIAFTIPAGFEGTVRVPLTLSERSYEDGSPRYSKGMAMYLAAGYKDGVTSPTLAEYANKSFSITNMDFVLNKNAELYPAPAAPEGLAGVACTNENQNDGSITGVNNTMEWRAVGGTWAPVEGDAITGLVPGSYEVRVAAASPYPAGASAQVKIAEWISPDAKDYVLVVEDFEDVAGTSEIITGIEYQFLGGSDWSPCENVANNSAAVKQMLFGDANNPFQKTLINTALGTLKDVEYVQMYLKWTGETEFEIFGMIGASRSTPAWYRWMEANVPGWDGTEDPSKFWKQYILMQGNTGALVSLTGAVYDVFIQDADGNWVKLESGAQGGKIPAGYEGYVRFPVAPEFRYDNVEMGMGWQLYDPTGGEIDGTMIVDDIALVRNSVTPVDGMVSFQEYVQIKGEGFNPDDVPTTTTTESTTTTKAPDLEFNWDDEDGDNTIGGDDDDKAPETGVVGMLIPMVLLAAAACLVMVLSRKAAKA